MKATLGLIVLFCFIVYIKSECVHVSDDIKRNGRELTRPWKTPIRLPDDQHRRLVDLCGFDFESKVCCNTTQIDKLESNFGRIAIVMFRCPACVWAIKRMFCDSTCSVDQSDYVKISGFLDKPEEKEFVKNFTLTIGEEGRRRIWEDSCIDNIVGATSLRNQYATAKDFFIGVFLMERSEPQIIFDLPDKEEGYVGPRFMCQETCRCSTCGAACGNVTQLSPNFDCEIYGIKCPYMAGGAIIIVFVSFIVAVAFIVVQTTVLTVKTKLEKNINNTEDKLEILGEEEEEADLIQK